MGDFIAVIESVTIGIGRQGVEVLARRIGVGRDWCVIDFETVGEAVIVIILIDTVGQTIEIGIDNTECAQEI